MNDSHRSYLVATLRHIDELLGGAHRILTATEEASPFNWYAPDASPMQRKVIEDLIADIGRVMARALMDLGLPRPTPDSGMLWGVQILVAFARTDVQEMSPARLAGYGPLTDPEIRAVENLAAELKAALARLAEYLAQGPDADLLARLRSLEQTREEVPLLRELERIITAHGLVTLRGTLATLLDRLEHERFEIGVFGRVSSGKSSLLNHLIGTAVLPVGVTPVTAFPTRIEYGEAPKASIEFAQSPPATVPLDRLSEFASERDNPGNRKRVTRIVVAVDAPRLRSGVTWVDTPGMGALAASGAAETAAYLPHCDLGLVLIDAANTLTQDDLVLVQTLLRSGANAMVLVSKADLLGVEERQHFLDYVRGQLAAQFSEAPPVHLISVVGPDAALCDSWFETILQPLLAAHREQAGAALKRKIGLLREAVARTLEQRISKGASARPSSVSHAASKAALQRLRAGEGLCATVQREADARLSAGAEQVAALLDAAASEVVRRWRSESSVNGRLVKDACTHVLRQQLGARAGEARNALLTLATQLDEALQQARQALAAVSQMGDALPKPAGVPLFDAAATTGHLDIHAPVFHRLIPTVWLCSVVYQQLQVQWAPSLGEFLQEYDGRLRAWFRASLDELRQSFRDNQAPLAMQLEASLNPGPVSSDETAAADLRKLRETYVDKK